MSGLVDMVSVCEDYLLEKLRPHTRWFRTALRNGPEAKLWLSDGVSITLGGSFRGGAAGGVVHWVDKIKAS